MGQLTSEVVSNPAVRFEPTSFGIDVYEVNGLNQYTSLGAVNGGDPAIPVYDSNGNMTLDQILGARGPRNGSAFAEINWVPPQLFLLTI